MILTLLVYKGFIVYPQKYLALHCANDLSKIYDVVNFIRGHHL